MTTHGSSTNGHGWTAVLLCAASLMLPLQGFAETRAQAISDAASAFLATLSDAQRSTVAIALDSDERATWSNLPTVMVRPPGLFLKDMNDEQKRAAHALMRATMSSQGYAKFSGIMLLEDLLYQIELEELEASETRRNSATAREFLESRDYGNYAVSIYGSPGAADWGWKIAGHHAAANFTISDGRIAFTPTFLGSNPMEVQSGRYAGLKALAHEGDVGIALMRSLDAGQQRKALVADSAARDVFEGPGRRQSLGDYEGIAAKELTAEQMHLLHRVVEEYLHNADHDSAHAQLDAIRDAGWDKVWFSWRGPVDPDGRFYYRVHGPRILIEYNRQNANHDHMIVRDPTNDYGEDWLGKHYEEHHPE